MRWLLLTILILPLHPVVFSQVEIDEKGEPVPFQEMQWLWLWRKLPIPKEDIGFRTQTRTENAHYLVFHFEPTRQVVEVTFWVKAPPKGQRGLSFGLSYGSPTHWANEAIRLALGGNGFLMQRDVGDWFTWRSNFSWLTIAPFQFNEWLKVRLVADPTIGAFQVWLNNRQAFPTNLPFLSPVPQLSCFFLFNGEGTGTEIEVTKPKIRIGSIPNAPKSLRVIPISHDRLQLKWQPSETPTVRSYRIYKRNQLVAEVKSDTKEWTDTNVKNGEAYSYFVTAVADLNGVASTVSSSVEQEPNLPISESLPSWQDAAMPLPKISPLVLRPSPHTRYDVIVIGATPAGIAAAISAARLGCKTALVERTTHIGGMMTGGLSATDRRYRQASGGLFAEFLKRVERFYAQAYGENSPQHRACRDGYLFEPKVALQVFQHMLAETSNLHIYLRHELVGVVLDNRSSINAVLLLDKNRGIRWRMDGRIFIDATYEGDLAAMAGVPYRVGREGRHEFGEEYAGEVFWDSRNRQITFGKPDGDKKVQAYNYRLTLTKRADNRRLIAAPPNYDPNLYAEIAERVNENVLWHPMEVVSLVKLPQQKFDANNTPGPFPSTDFIGANYEYPEADWHKREEIARKHRNYIVGLLYFLQTDQRLPNEFRVTAQHWGFAEDEFVENENFPPQLYVREARRIIGEYIFTEHDARPVFAGRRAPVHEDSIAVAEYPIDSHATTPRDPKQPYLHEGFFYLPQITVPSHVPYRVMVSKGRGTGDEGRDKRVDNLLVCGAVSATHIGFGTLRLEPVWMSLGQAAGTAAHLVLTQSLENPSVRSVPIDQLQRLLLRQGQVIAFFNDLPPPNTEEFEAVQFFAVRGFFDTYEARPNEPADEGAARKILHRFAELVRRPIPFAFGTAREKPLKSEIVKWLAALFDVREDKAKEWCGVRESQLDEPISRGELCVWLYRIWWSIR
ncbi:MAG: FAD-dependent oxidoreductase [Armatimonadota bacterium]